MDFLLWAVSISTLDDFFYFYLFYLREVGRERKEKPLASSNFQKRSCKILTSELWIWKPRKQAAMLLQIILFVWTKVA